MAGAFEGSAFDSGEFDVGPSGCGYQRSAYQSAAYQSCVRAAVACSFQGNAFQANGFQPCPTTGLPCSFQSNAFQGGAFQPCPITAPPCSFQEFAFQQNAFQPCPGPIPPQPPSRRRAGWFPGWRRRERELERDPFQQGFTRQTYDEIQQLLAAERRAADRADEIKSPSAQRALDEALEAAAELESLQLREREAAELTRLLDSAARAEGMRKVIAEANAATAYVKRIVAELEDEEDAIVLLLS